jgi:predicted ATP-binding protein involved in virulence/sRNA-binding regulator protein Hfq
LVGENGSGKTTLLRALGLGTIGSKNKDINLLKVENMLRVKSWQKGKMNFAEEGAIELHYTMDSKAKTQKITFNNNGIIEINDKNNFEMLLNHLDLKTLVIGFPQIRASKKSHSRQVRTHANVADIIPLINNIDDGRLESFSSWLINLQVSGQTKLIQHHALDFKDIEEFILIEKVFDIISQFTKHDIKFEEVGSAAPPLIIVKTFDSPEGIPLDLLSQGFKILIGWIGHFLQRLAEFNPMNKHNFEQENAIVIVDEIDSYIHPIWQQGFLQTLREIFPNTQFIVSTHSPLLVAGLNRAQIVELEYNEETKSVDILEEQVDTWAMSYADILLKLFNTKEPDPTKIIGELRLKLQNLDDSNSEEKLSLQEDIRRLEKSAAYLNEVEEYKQKLEEREEELEQLMEELNSKLENLK